MSSQAGVYVLVNGVRPPNNKILLFGCGVFIVAFTIFVLIVFASREKSGADNHVSSTIDKLTETLVHGTVNRNTRLDSLLMLLETKSQPMLAQSYRHAIREYGIATPTATIVERLNITDPLSRKDAQLTIKSIKKRWLESETKLFNQLIDDLARLLLRQRRTKRQVKIIKSLLATMSELETLQKEIQLKNDIWNRDYVTMREALENFLKSRHTTKKKRKDQKTTVKDENESDDDFDFDDEEEDDDDDDDGGDDGDSDDKSPTNRITDLDKIKDGKYWFNSTALYHFRKRYQKNEQSYTFHGFTYAWRFDLNIAGTILQCYGEREFPRSEEVRILKSIMYSFTRYIQLNEISLTEYKTNMYRTQSRMFFATSETYTRSRLSYRPSCGVTFYPTMDKIVNYENENGCGARTWIHEYGHFIDFALSGDDHNVNWWIEGIATYVMPDCVFHYSPMPDKLLSDLTHVQEPYSVGSQLFGFLDSSDKLKMYLKKIRFLRMGNNWNQQKYSSIINEVASNYRHLYNSDKCKSYQRYYVKIVDLYS